MSLPTAPSFAHSLLVSRDPATIEQITDAMARLAIATEVCVDVASARHVLHTKKFDAVTVDFGLSEQAPGILGEMRISPSNRTAPAIAITRSKSDLALAYCAGSNFTLERPLSADSLSRTLTAGYGWVVRERRRYFRCRVRTRIVMRRVDMRQAQSHTVNISEGGMEIAYVPAKLVPKMRILVEFMLPGRTENFRAVCETCWRGERGRAGLRFLLLPLEQRCDLQEWLAERLEESLPESIAWRFREANDRFRSGPVAVPPPPFLSGAIS
ncbi:MAG: PilZ domain-containing protein [Acidobacteriia bacterium]|nr:PilZ domain-containing protein [Terriglobia bacterium]